MRTNRPIFTIGHSTRTLDELVGLLRAQGIAVLVDIRTIRRSRANPQFNADVLGLALARAGIRYEALPSLGGLRRKVKGEGPSPNSAWESAGFRNFADYAMGAPFHEGLEHLIRIGAREPTAIMCAEAVWWRCHRRIVADYLLARGVPVVHLFTSAHADAATLTPFAVVDEEGDIVRYPEARQGEPGPSASPAATRSGASACASSIRGRHQARRPPARDRGRGRRDRGARRRRRAS